MEFKKLISKEDRAVSPVIGVILMVAITVILAAVIGAFVLGIGGDMATTPQASFTITNVDADNGELTIEHTGGDPLNGGSYDVLLRGDGTNIDSATESSADFSTGVQLTIAPSGGDINYATGGSFTSYNQIEVLLIDQDSEEVISRSTAST